MSQEDSTFEFEYCPRGEVARLTQKLEAAQRIIDEQAAELQRLRDEVEDLQQPAALGWDASVRRGLLTPAQIERSDRSIEAVKQAGRRYCPDGSRVR